MNEQTRLGFDEGLEHFNGRRRVRGVDYYDERARQAERMLAATFVRELDRERERGPWLRVDEP